LKPPIVIAAFGTTSRSRSVYGLVDAYLKSRFGQHEIHWAFTSRLVRHRLNQRRVTTRHPAEVVADLATAGHSWVVVQSLNMICGHEFYRLIDDVQGENPACRVSVGHSLLCSQADHEALCTALAPLFDPAREEAVLLVGHGTDHCSWTTYPAFYQRLRERYGRQAYGGMIEEGYPERDTLIDAILKEGFKRVHLVPFMLVSGVHFEEDLAGDTDSWKSACEARGLCVTLESGGLGQRPAVLEIFADHIASALAVIPATKRPHQPAGALQAVP
jgi:sirohydrochlorin cobaltochelatase